MTVLERLSAEDARILRLESAAICGHTCKVLLVDPDAEGRSLTVEALRERVAARVGGARRARQRVVPTPLRIASPVWLDDPDFDVDYHVRGTEGAVGGGDAELREVAGRLMGERLDRSRPLWRTDVVGPLADGRIALVTRIHHCMADGIGAVRLGSLLFWDRASDAVEDPGEGRPLGGLGGGREDGAGEGGPGEWPDGTPQPARERVPGAARLLAAGLATRASAPASALAGAARALAQPGRWPMHARDLLRLPGTLRRELGGRTAASPFDRHLGAEREVAWATVPLAELRALEDAFDTHVTINDLVLAIVAGALRHWLERRGEEPAAMRVKIPVSMHARDERPDAIGNRDSFLFVGLPVTEADPVRRLMSIAAETRERKLRGDAAELYTFFHGLSHFRPLEQIATRVAMGAREFGLSVSNVPGPRELGAILGHAVSGLHTFAEPAEHHALRVAVISLAGALSFGLCTDPRAVAGLDVLAEGIELSMGELLDRAREVSA